MSIFGWSYPPGCHCTPYDDMGAVELRCKSLPEGYTAWWDEDGRITVQDEEGYRVRTLPGTVDWNDDLSEEQNLATAVAELEKIYE